MQEEINRFKYLNKASNLDLVVDGIPARTYDLAAVLDYHFDADDIETLEAGSVLQRGEFCFHLESARASM